MKNKHVRISAKAVIINKGKLFVIHHRRPDGDYFLLPGGGQRNGESLITAVKRECLEEAGIKIKVGDVVYIREYKEDYHEFAARKPGFHQVEIMFQCEILDGSGIGKGEQMDDHQIGVAWLPLGELDNYRLYPAILIKVLQNRSEERIYLGDKN